MSMGGRSNGRRTLRLAGALFLGAALAAGLPAVFPAAAGELPWVKINNIERQDYDRWSSPVSSCLVPLDDGTFMCVQGGNGTEGLLVTYHDASFHVTGIRMVAQELPLFGGFYAADDGFYLLTGQENPSQSADVAVLRLTRYDQDWNKTGQAEIKDCNTVLPFRAGTARMDTCGDYLLIRTSHRMYKTKDGVNHQANMTVEIDRKTMKVTDISAGVKAGVGYVSHSFNQFVLMDGNAAVTLDHGDAYPRALVLTKYPDVSDGTFQPSGREKCWSVHVMDFPGVPGDNDTGASAGGLEISASSYLAAGNSVRQDGGKNHTRNVFVASVDRETLKTRVHWLTSYEEGDGTTSTPQMVKLSGTRFLILWSREGSVFYTKINGRGARTSDIYRCPGNLSDCAPVSVNNKVIWYTCKDGLFTFYRIDQDKMGCTVAERSLPAAGTEPLEKTVQKGQEAASGNGRYTVTKAGRTGKAEAAFTGVSVNGDGKKHVAIPAEVMIAGVRCKVTSIAPGALRGQASLVRIVVGKNVRRIGRGAFRGCRKLKRIVLRTKKLKAVGKNAVKGISAKAVIKVPKDKKRVYRKIFREKNRYKIKIIG